MEQDRKGRDQQVWNDVWRHAHGIARSSSAALANRAVLLALVVVLSLDMAIDLLDIFYRYRRIEGPTRVSEYFYLSNDGSIGEYFEYALTALAAAMLLTVGWRSRSRVILLGGVLFAWLTLDNYLMVHESGGGLLQSVAGSGQMLGLDVQDIGELGVYALSGIALLIGLLWAIRPPLSAAEVMALGAIGIAAGSAIFGVGVDIVHSLIPRDYPILREVAGFIEDSGELWMLSLAWLLVLGLFVPPAPDKA